MVIENDGNDPVSGTFSGLSEGATFIAGVATFKISYIGGDGNDVVLALPTPDIVLNSVTSDGNTMLTVRYQILNSALAAPLAIRFLKSTDTVASAGDPTFSDVAIKKSTDLTVGRHEVTFVIGKAGSQVALPGMTSTKDDDTDYFVLAVADPVNLIEEVDSDPLNEDNTVVFAGAYATPKGVFVHGGASADTVSLRYPSTTAGAVELAISGSMTANYSYSYDVTSQFRIRTHGGNDVVNVVSSSDPVNVVGKALFEAGGDGDDTLISDVGKDVLDGGSGIDTLVASGNVNFVLTNAQLKGLGTDTLVSIESANLTGGNDSNTFTVTGWTGTGSFVGGGVNSVDTIVASKDVNFTLSDSVLQTSDNMNLSLSGINRAMLTGGGSANSFELTGWTGSGKLTGGSGNDTLAVTRNADITVTTTSSLTALDSVGFNTMTLATIEAVNLTGGTGNNVFTLNNWLGAGIVTGGGGSDAVVVNATKGAVNFTLTDTQLVMTNGLNLSLVGIGTASLIGGTSANLFDVGGWHGTGSLIGGGGKGIDTVIASADADFTLAGDQLTVAHYGLNSASISLSAVKRANLTGLVRTHRFIVTGWTPAGTSDKDAGVLGSYSRP